MAQDGASVPVEAAASLFGTEDDAGLDFFASNFDNVQQPQNGSSREQPTSLHDPVVASNLFEAGPDETMSSLLQSTSYDSLQPDTNILDSSQEAKLHDTQVTPSGYDYHGQGWHAEHGQSHAYDYQNGYTSTYDYASQPKYSADIYAPAEPVTQQYDYTSQQSTGYAPPQQSDYSKPQDTYAPQQQPPHQYSYTTQESQSAYASSAPVPQNSGYPQSAYDPYAPTVPTPAGLPNIPTVPYGGKVMASQGVQFTKDVKAYRPTSLNAYDPPIPSKTRSKARSTLPAPQAGPTSPNGIPDQYSSPPLQPPPPPMAPEPLSSYTQAVKLPMPANVVFYDDKVRDWPQSREETHPTSWSEPPMPSNESIHEDGDLTPLESGVPYDGAPPQSQPDPRVVTAKEDSISHQLQATRSLYGFNSEDVSASDDVDMGHSGNTTTSGPHLTSYSLDDQPFGGSQTSTKTLLPSVSPPPLTGSPVDYTPHATTSVDPYVGHPADRQTYDPYHPTQHSRQNSGASHVGSISSQPRPASTKAWDPYAPSSTSSNSHDSYGTQNSSFNDAQAPQTDSSHNPYTTYQLPRAQSRQSESSYDGEYTSRYNYPNAPDPGTLGRPDMSSESDAAVGYANVTSAPTYAPYAPSPSLLGTNDPLGRAAARVPVISFGFGGKFVSCFHSAGETASGFDVSLTARQVTDVQFRTLYDVIPASAMGSSTTSYPGPLFSDPGVPSISLARTVGVGAGSNVKTKRTLVSKWLEERAEELAGGVAYIPAGSQEKYNAEARLVLVRLLKAMVDNDGQLSGSPSIEWAVRSALIPRLASEGLSSKDGLPSTESLPSYASVHADLNEPSLAVYHLRSSALDRIQEFLLRGERQHACHYAMDEKLWAHAMLIASSIDTQTWKDVVNEFLHAELSVKQPLGLLSSSRTEPGGSTANGRESLRVAYSLYAGQGAAAVQELVPLQSLPPGRDSLLAPPAGFHPTPISPNFPQPALTSSVSPEALAKWHETAAVMAFSQNAGDSAALTALGDYLAANRWFEAAHACYLLSPRTSSLGGAGVPSVRVVLVGSETPSILRNFNKDLDVTIFSEIVEFALSLSPSKGQDAFGGLPHLQAYKLVRAAHLAEMGHVEVANRYCEAIGSTIRSSTRGSTFYTPTFFGELKNLSDRLTAAPQLDKTASWISRKMTKPSLDTIGTWLEGRFSKLIVGDGEDGAESGANKQAQPAQSSYGPFSHYSTISSATSSASPSPSPRPYGPGGIDNPSTPFSSQGNSHIQIDRASSAMDHLRPEVRRASPVPRVASASAATTTFAQALNPVTRYRQAHETVSGVPESDVTSDTESQEVAWWGSGSHQDRSGPTPTATTFYKVDEDESSDKFVSLMDDYSPGMTPMATTSSQSFARSKTENVEEDEDLGFGNSISRTPKADTRSLKEEDKPKDEAQSGVGKPELKQQPSSWFGRWWSKGSEPAPSGPIKAKLGEETSFYYDKELKRWVNKKAGADASAPSAAAPPPPPSRARTASPATGGPPGTKAADDTGPPLTGPPPARPASAAANATAPARKPPRVRSNLVPKEDSIAPGSAPPSATSFDTAKSGLGLAPPSGIGRPKSSAAKRNVRSRYVDVFQQQGES